VEVQAGYRNRWDGKKRTKIDQGEGVEEGQELANDEASQDQLQGACSTFSTPVTLTDEMMGVRGQSKQPTCSTVDNFIASDNTSNRFVLPVMTCKCVE
jgi:hypothetical protein